MGAEFGVGRAAAWLRGIGERGDSGEWDGGVCVWRRKLTPTRGLMEPVRFVTDKLAAKC